ncbi:hypothetical protein HK099_006544 [Clydaea vesicula]|uniref:Ribose-phosphate diphosphokinase n=1 Tax=Clydaea vesicula TaxID=447962 RepID=A0AAD5TY64_9FUNG|nr:hypothetical protein HK099_006544 [Clydaea vesicula]
MVNAAKAHSVVANMLKVAGVDHIITMDLHSSQMQGFFSYPSDNLLSEPGFTRYIRENFDTSNCVIVSKNAGGTKRVTSLADRLNAEFAMIHRERYHIEQSQKQTDDDEGKIETRLTLVGDVKGKICFLIDDIIDGTHSFLDACKHLKTCEASRVIILAVHGILSGDGLKEIQECEDVDEVITTNTYPMKESTKALSNKLTIMDISGVFAEAIRRTHNGESISYLFHTAI